MINSVHAGPIHSTAELADLVDTLVSAWCDRRALGALRQILAGWPSAFRITEDWELLREALRNVVGVSRSELTNAEIESVHDCIAAIDIAMRRASPSGDIGER
jgi:hypothetical protein